MKPTAEDQRQHENKNRKKKIQALQRKTERESNEFGGKIEFVTKRQIRPTVSNQGEW